VAAENPGFERVFVLLACMERAEHYLLMSGTQLRGFG
jgi:hypothetical protein